MKKTLFPLMLLFIFVLAGCAKKDERALLDEAKAKLDSHDVVAAVEQYQNFLTEFPESPNAPEVLMQLGGIFQSGLDTRVTGNASLEKAITFYQQVHDKFPQAKEAPKALFLIAFVQANELKQFDAAKANYQKFIDTYPNDPLLQSAKDEVNNVGVPPEEIIRRKTATAGK
jgi:TolA-binding protein